MLCSPLAAFTDGTIVDGTGWQNESSNAVLMCKPFPERAERAEAIAAKVAAEAFLNSSVTMPCDPLPPQKRIHSLTASDRAGTQVE